MSLSKLGVLLGVIGISFTSGSVLAQETERFVTVGQTSDGLTINLDTQSIRDTRYKLYFPYGTGIAESTFNASCGESRLFLLGTALYSDSGKLLVESKKSEEVGYIQKSPPGQAMALVCRRIGARGW
ncbi:hypothetical protein A4S05_23475 [Nostoc sp. KVJ20]|uniref:hypothetical protein n=1 Tax=Nostoc sp. KVJ20 TaxID=457944 RepID=UPI00083CE389|nr:hypothetical protein [Nostoc sp. KVJ20]ODH02574.1 hypothetical protein A4S05_23475 [Nostoc sp. KVJ20]